MAKPLTALGVTFVAFGLYRLRMALLPARVDDRRRGHDLRDVARLLFVAAALAGVVGILTARWVELLFSLGVVGSAVTFALQQPLFSLRGGGTSSWSGRTKSATGSPPRARAATSSTSTTS